MSKREPPSSRVNVDLDRAIDALLSDRKVAYDAALARAVGSVTAGVLLCQFLYWQPRAQGTLGWFWKTQAEIYDETALSRKEQETARRVLREAQVLEEKRAGVPAKLYFRINLMMLKQLLASPQSARNGHSSLPETGILERPDGAPQSARIVPTLTESTTETTTENFVVVDALRNSGISEAVATQLAQDHEEAYILAKVDLIHWLQEHRPTTVGKNPAGALRRAIEDDWTPPLSYQPPAQRAALAQQRAAEHAAEQHHQQALDQEYQRSQEETALQLAALCPPQPIPRSGLTTATAWDQTRTILEAEMTAGNFSFIKQARLARCDGHVALVVAPYSYHLDHLSGRLHPLITHALSTVLGAPITCEYTTLSKLTDQSARHPTGAAAAGDALPERDTHPSQESLAPSEPNGYHPSPQPRRGRPPKTELVGGP